MTLRQFVRERKNFLQERELEAGLPLSSRRNVHQENFSPLMRMYIVNLICPLIALCLFQPKYHVLCRVQAILLAK